MKIQKILALVLACIMLTGVLAACGGNGGSSNETTKATETTGAADTASNKSYQFYGKFEESGEYASMLNAAFLLNLNEDGSAVVDKYAFGTYDASDASSNSGFVSSYLSGKWKEVEKDGVACLQIKLAYVDESGTESNSQTCYAYDIAGVYSFEMTFPVVPGQSYTRVVTMEGKEEKAYADANAFIQAYAVTFEAPESVGTFVDAENNATAYLQADGTVLVYAGYDKFAEGKWMKTEDGISISLGGEAVEVTMDGSKASFTVSRSMDGAHSSEYNLVCEDISVLPDAEVSEDAPYTCSMDMGGNETTAELTLNDDGTGNLKVFTDIPVTYEKIGSAVVLSANGELEGYGAQIWGAISHTFVLNEDHSMSSIVAAYNADSLALLLLDESNMKVEFPSYNMSREGFTYTLSEDGATLTVTAPSEEELGAFAQIWTGAGADTWTIDGNTAVKAG